MPTSIKPRFGEGRASEAIAQGENGLRWNPEVNRAEAPIRENLQALLTSRIDRLGEDARRTLQMFLTTPKVKRMMSAL